MLLSDFSLQSGASAESGVLGETVTSIEDCERSDNKGVPRVNFYQRAALALRWSLGGFLVVGGKGLGQIFLLGTFCELGK